MNELREARAEYIAALEEVGLRGLLTVPNAVSADDGTVQETPTTHEILCSDIVDESKRYGDTGAIGTFYVAAGGLSVAPKPGHRIGSLVPTASSETDYAGRVFSIVNVFPYRVQGGTYAWRVDVGETAIPTEAQDG